MLDSRIFVNTLENGPIQRWSEMKALKVAAIVLLVIAAAGCNKTKFNRGVYEVPGDVKRWTKQDLDKFRTIPDDISRRVEHSYGKAVDMSNDVQRWTSQEWNNFKENVNWTVVQIGHEFQVITGAAQYVKRRWKNFGPKMKGLWMDSYRFIEYELNTTRELDDQTKRILKRELERFSEAKKGLRRWTKHRGEETKGLIEFIKKVYKEECARGSRALESIKDYFTKPVM